MKRFICWWQSLSLTRFLTRSLTRSLTLWLALFLAPWFTLWFTNNALAETVSPAEFEQSLQAMATHTGDLDTGLQDSMLALYRALDYPLIWHDPELLAQLQDGIEDSYHDGLNPRDYRLPAPLPEATLVDDTETRAAQIKRDIRITGAFITLLQHLYYGKVDPSSLNPDWNIDDLRRLDESREFIALALGNKDVASLLKTARPRQAIYEDLKASLAHYRAIEAEGGWLPIQIDTLLRPGQRNAAVESLRQRLTVSGDYPPELAIDGTTNHDKQLFDSQLADAARHFQRRHMLAADGIVGPATLAAMNRSVGRRIDQIRANLERMRWFLKGLDEDFLLVDIAGYVLYLVQGDDISWSSDIQVGLPYRQTPILKSRIAYLEWNPTWTVPPTILREDVLPAIKTDVNYLQKQHMDVLTYQGAWVDPASIDWQRYPARPFPYMIRQRPGPWNALGTVKFIFPNEHLVYLHDTPSKYLFKHSNRAFSSGCIRVARPYELARLLLGAKAGRQIENILNSGVTRRQYLQQSFPIVLLYWTTKLQRDGSLVFAPDIYHRDARVLLALDVDLPPLMSPR